MIREKVRRCDCVETQQAQGAARLQCTETPTGRRKFSVHGPPLPADASTFASRVVSKRSRSVHRRRNQRRRHVSVEAITVPQGLTCRPTHRRARHPSPMLLPWRRSMAARPPSLIVLLPAARQHTAQGAARTVPAEASAALGIAGAADSHLGLRT